MHISQVMSKTIVSVTPDTPFRQVWAKVFQKKVNAIPVVDAQGRLMGMITREDLLKPLYPNYQDIMENLETMGDFEKMESRIREKTHLKAKDIMSKRVVFTRTDTQVMRALSRMIVRDVHQLPVVTDDNKVVGMVTKGDVFYMLFRKHFSAKKPEKKR